MSSEIRDRIREKLVRIWWFVLLRGIVLLLLGLFFVLSPLATLATLSLFLGAYWFIQGICSILGLFVNASDLSRGWLLFEGIIGILAGIFVMNHRLFVPATLVILLAIQALLIGAVHLIQGLGGDGARAVILGSLNLLFGILLFGHPLLAASLVPILFGILAILGGLVLVVLALRVRMAVRGTQIR